MMKVLTTAVVGIIASSAAHAAGFSVYGEGNGINASNFGAGAAAEVHDASTAWYNPAGLALIHNKQAVAGGTAIIASGKLSGTTNYTSFGVPDYPDSFSNIQGGKNAFIPSFAYAQPIGENATFGLSVVTPFGLATNWKNDSPVRYAATNSELLTIDVSPSVGGKIHENVAIGLGLDIQYASVIFNRVLGDPAYANNAGSPVAVFDATSHNEGDSVGLGFHAGILAMFNDNHTRIGLNYQSEVKHKFNGHSTLTGRLADTVGPLTNPLASFRTDDLQSNAINMPAITTLSGYHDVNDQWALLGSVVYTQWDTIKNIVLTNVADPYSTTTNGNLKLQSTSTLNYKNAWRLAAGANYKVNETFTLRFGGGYDETPTNNVDRDVRLPDSDRWTLAIGGDYQVRPDMKVGFGWTHFFFDTSRVNKTDTAISIGGGQQTPPVAGSFNVTATGKTHADLFGAQLVWDIDHVEPTK